MAETDRPPEPADRCRLTILDLLLLTFSYALGFGISRWAFGGREGGENPLELALMGLIFGSGVASPVAVVSQWTLRRRRIRISLGEWLWIAPLVNWRIAVAGSANMSWADKFVGLALASQSLCATLAIVFATVRLSGDWGRVECRWTYLFGCGVCIVLGFVEVFLLAAMPTAR